MTIRVLDEQLVSQIAAGEVVERPASIVKELVENSLDAGATRIAVDVEEGGLRRIRVADDGRGIARDQLPRAVARHATSKIDSLDALESVASLRFRGEALASIASVAELTLTSRAAGADSAFAMTAQGDAPIRPAAGGPGTRVEVRELFARIPARRKFLRTPATEFKHLRQVFNQLALSRCDVVYSLKQGRAEAVQLPACQNETEQKQRAATILGDEFAAHAVTVDEAAAGMRLTGWVATPGFSRGQADRQYSFVNRRPIRDKLFNHAVRQAYRDLLHHQRYPAYVLYLTLDSRQIDVNAHPAKAEVRFREARLVHDFVSRSVSWALAAVEASPHEARTIPPESFSQTSGAAAAGAPMSPRGLDFGAHAERRPAAAETAASYAFQRPPEPPAADPPAPADGIASGAGQTVAGKADAPPLGYAIGQLHDIYILAQNDAGLVLVDMHAAHERVLYEQLKAEFSAGRVQAKQLLVPETLALSENEAASVESRGGLLAEVGFDLDRGGPTSALLRGIPLLLADQDYLTIARDVIAELDSGPRGAAVVRDRIDDVLADMGCKAAIKAGRRLSLAEMNALLRDMEHTDRAGHCNHGRPSWISIDRAGLDRLFMRGQ
jgi:DNA mismatch repair protein MutL